MHKAKFIAEICSNHNKDLKRCLRFVDVAKILGCYAVKFQLFTIPNLYSNNAKKLYKKALKKRKRELPRKFIPAISNYCKKRKIKFCCTPFDIDSVNFLKPYVDFFKIASYELLWSDLLKSCAKTKKPILLSTGMANFSEVKKAVKVLKKNNCKKIELLHCVSNYPANISSCNLKSIDFMKNFFNCDVGWSDHTVNPLIIYSAIRNHNADLIEFHLDLDGKGWEHKSGNHCWLPHEIKEVIEFIEKEKKVDGSYKKNFSKEEKKERMLRADPLDGLRPLRRVRKNF